MMTHFTVSEMILGSDFSRWASFCQQITGDVKWFNLPQPFFDKLSHSQPQSSAMCENDPDLVSFNVPLGGKFWIISNVGAVPQRKKPLPVVLDVVYFYLI